MSKWGGPNNTKVLPSQMNPHLHANAGKTLKAETQNEVALPEVLHDSSGEIKYFALGSYCQVLFSFIVFELRESETCFSSSWICSCSLHSFRSQPGLLLREGTCKHNQRVCRNRHQQWACLHHRQGCPVMKELQGAWSYSDPTGFWCRDFQHQWQRKICEDPCLRGV